MEHIFDSLKSLDADKKASKTSEAAPAAAEKVAEKVDFSNVKIEPIFIVFRTLLNCLKCIIYEDRYRIYG